MDRYPAGGTHADIEELDPAPSRPGTARPLGGRLARSFPGVVAGTFLVAAIAFGAALRPSAGGPGNSGGSGGDTAGAAAALGNDGTTGADGDYGNVGGGDWDKAEGSGTDADASPKTEPTDMTKPPADGGDPAEVGAIDLALHLRDGFVKLEWGACERDAFRYYKVVRSGDEAVAWPLGAKDTLVAAIADMHATVAADGDLTPGARFYRVFALVERDGGLVVGCQSAVRGLEIPAPAPKPEPTEKPAPTDKPSPSGSVALSLAIKEGEPYVDWSECGGDFDYYKVVRSTDSTVTWPKGEGDSLAGAVGRDGKTALLDGDAPAGKKVWYRVFCVRETDAGYKVVAASDAKGIAVPAAEPQPEPDPVNLGFEAAQTAEGVRLDWEGCGSELFVFYKVLRSHGSDPSYLPGTDGTQVIAVIENPGVTAFTDGDVEAGQTWYYRIQAIGYVNGHKILLGETAAIVVAVE